MSAWQTASTASRVLMILESLSIREDWMHCVSLAACIDPQLTINNDRDLIFTDGSALRRNGRGMYLSEDPAIQFSW